MATTRSRRRTKTPSIKGASLSGIQVFDYSKGQNSYLANDAMPLDQLRLAQDSRISTLGRMVTRKGANFYSDALGETVDDQQVTVTGAADQSIGTTVLGAAKLTTTTLGRMTKVELNLKSNTGTAPIIVELRSDNSGEPGAVIATSSIVSTAPGGTYAYLPARFVDAPQVSDATVYWVVAYQQVEGSGTINWSSTTAATDSLASTDNGVTWDSTTYDLNVKSYISTDGGTKGLFRAYKSDGTKETLLAAEGTLSKISDVDGSLTSINAALSSSATKYRFANINDEVFYVNGVDVPRKYNFTTDAAMTWGTSGGSDAPVASLITAHQDYIWLNDVTDPTRLEFSDEDSYEASASTSFIYVPSPKSPEPIVAMRSLNGVLHVFTTAGIYSLYGSDKATFQLIESQVRKGGFSQEATAVTRSHIFFMSDDGIYSFNGVEAKLISIPITDKIERMTNKDSVVMGINNNRLNVYYRNTGSAENDKCLVYNIDYDSWESEDTNQYVSHTSQWEGGTDSFEYVTASSRVGQAYKWGEESNDYSDLGKPLNFELRTAYLFGKNPNAKKIWKRWYPRFEKQSRTYNVEVQTDTNFTNSPTSFNISLGASGITWGGGATWGDGSVYGSTVFDSDRVHVPGQSYYLQLRIKKTGVNTPVEFLGNSLQLSEKRVR